MTARACRASPSAASLARASQDWHLTLPEFRELVNSRLPAVGSGRVEAKAREQKILMWYQALDVNGDGSACGGKAPMRRDAMRTVRCDANAI